MNITLTFVYIIVIWIAQVPGIYVPDFLNWFMEWVHLVLFWFSNWTLKSNEPADEQLGQGKKLGLSRILKIEREK